MWKKWISVLTKFTANANGKFRLLFFLSNRPNRETHKYLLITMNRDIFTFQARIRPDLIDLLLMLLKSKAESASKRYKKEILRFL